MTNPRHLTLPALLTAVALGFAACGTSDPNDEGAPVVTDERQAPGNDNGLERDENRLGETEDNVIGTIGSYEGAGLDDDGDYEATVGMEDDNPNRLPHGEGNDPVTPNAPLADGTAGQPDQAALPTGTSARDAAGNPGGQSVGGRAGDPEPYGTSMAPRGSNGLDTSGQRGEKTYVGAQAATDLPVFVPGGDLDAYISKSYGSGGAGPRNSPTEQPEGDRYEISTYRPAMSDVAAASYTETQTKLAKKPSSQNYLVYQPVQLKIVPLLAWDAPAEYDEEQDVDPTLSEACATAEDGLGCSGRAFQASIAPLINDQRVAKAIADGEISEMDFELDASGKVVPSSIRIKSGSKACYSADCNRLRGLLAGVIANQSWTPAQRGGSASGARVIVPFQYDVKLAGTMPNTP